MKRFLFPIVLASSLAVAQDQFQTGVYSLRGIVSYDASVTNTGSYSLRNTTFILSPGIAYFLMDQVEIIFAPSYLASTSKYLHVQPGSAFSDGVTYHNLSFMLGFRYYIPVESVGFFAGSLAGLSWSKLDRPFSPPTSTYQIEAGLDYLISRNAAIEGILTYTRTKFQQRTSEIIGIGLGAKYFIL